MRQFAATSCRMCVFAAGHLGGPNRADAPGRERQSAHRTGESLRNVDCTVQSRVVLLVVTVMEWSTP